MIQMLAAIPTIISAVGKVSELFKKGKEVVEAIKGQPSVASTPAELQTEVQQMTPDEQNRWAEVMAREVERYAKQNERLAIEIGLVDQNITAKLTAEAANDIAMLRMTTRPWTVRWMVHYVLFPFYLVALDAVQQLTIAWLPFLHTRLGIEPFMTFDYVFGRLKVPEELDVGAVEKLLTAWAGNGGPGAATFAGDLYMESIPWVVSIILGYMGLREIGKARGHVDAEAPGVAATQNISLVSKTLSEGVGLAAKVRGWFGNK